MSERIPVDAADAAWIRMDHAENRMVIVAVLTFDRPMPTAEFARLVEERLLRFDRFRRRLAGTGDRLTWELDPGFSVDRQVIESRLPPGAGEPELEAHVGDLMSLALPADRPPWQFEVIPEFGAGSAVVARLHHGIADGMALVGVLLGLADGAPPVEAVSEPVPGTGGTLDFVTSLARGTVRAAGSVVEETVAMIMEPDRAFLRARQGVGIAAALGKFALVPPDSPTPFRAPLTTTKRVAWSPACRLPDVKRAAKALGGTVNDVLLTVLAGGMGRFLALRGSVDPACEIRAVVPVNLRPPDAPLSLGNRFGLVLVALPVGIVDVRLRFAEVRARMDRVKQSMEPAVALGILQAIGTGPRWLQDQVVRSLSASSSAVMTNVPGPRRALRFAGRTLEQVMFWVPRAGSIGLGVSILSYADRVLVGFAVDAAHVSDPRGLVRAFEAEWSGMLALVQ